MIQRRLCIGLLFSQILLISIHEAKQERLGSIGTVKRVLDFAKLQNILVSTEKSSILFFSQWMELGKTSLFAKG
jgi:hypothetical protein